MSHLSDSNGAKLANALTSDKTRTKRARISSNGNSHQVTSQLSSDAKHTAQGRMVRKRFTECCYSIANLALIVAAVIALIVLVKFIQDDPLYEYGEHILSLAFFRQLIYVIAIVPLVLLVPIFNALSACFLWRTRYTEEGDASGAAPEAAAVRRSSPLAMGNQLRQQQRYRLDSYKHLENQQSVLVVKLIFELLLIILLFIALIFVGPNVSSSTLASQIELELRKHMAHRYGNPFSYQFLDLLQQQYECCDKLWYRSNMYDELPTSCFVLDNTYTREFDRNCSDAIGSLVATRCAIIAACLVILLISLAILFAVDIFHWLTLKTMSTSRRFAKGARYEFVAADARHANTMAVGARVLRPGEEDSDEGAGDGDGRAAGNSAPTSPPSRERHAEPDDIAHRLSLDDPERQALISGRPALGEAKEGTIERAPLGSSGVARREKRDFGASATEAAAGKPLEEHRASPTILARANYATVRRERSQSPAYVDSLAEGEQRWSATSTKTTGSQLLDSQKGERPIKSSLKKTSSFQKIEIDEGEISETEEGESPAEYAQKLRQNTSSLLRQQQTRRSLLNVRFADC